MEDSKVKKTGTTTVGIIGTDGVILASEKRTTAGYIVSDDSEKVYEIDTHIGMAGAGVAGDMLALVRILRIEARLYRMRERKSMSIEAACNLLSNIMYQYKMFPFLTAIIFGGTDEKGNTKLFTLDPYGDILEVKDHTAFGGSGWPSAQAVLDSLYEKKSIKELIPLAVKAINAAKKRDPNSGGDVDIVVITKEGFKRLNKEEIEKIISELKKRK
jgi:proteasome beta subunit